MKKKSRNANELYPTFNSGIIIEPVKKIIPSNDKVLECCAGHNHIGRHFSNVITVDKYRYQGFEPDFYLDMTLEDSWKFLASLKFDWVVTNPPFSLAPIILPLAYKYATKGVIFLLRLSYLEPCKDRSEWLKANSRQHSDLIIMNPRINFHIDKNGTDNVTSAWFAWKKDYNDLTKITYFNY